MKLNNELEEMVNAYAEVMKTKLFLMQTRGYSGFNKLHMQGLIEQKLKKNLEQKDWIDVGALSAMRWWFINKKAVLERNLEKEKRKADRQ